MMTSDYSIVDNGDAALTLLFTAPVSEQLSRQITQQAEAVKQIAGVCEVIPAYQSLTVCYQPLSVSSEELKQQLVAQLETDLTSLSSNPRLIEVPVCYQEGFAPDLNAVAAHCQLSEKELIERHSKPVYLVHMLGFLPGFVYLGGLDPRLNCPRKHTPVTCLPQGSVGIGGDQTGVYPCASPGGWNIIGRTPLHFFRPEAKQPFIASPLDKIKFTPIDPEEFERLQRLQP